MPPFADDDHRFMAEALTEARQGQTEGGVPIGSVLVVDGVVVGRGHNRRVQSGDPILHGEMDCLRHAGRRRAEVYRRATIYTTLSPCDMCTGAILLFGIPRVVLAENRTFRGAEDLLRARGVELRNLDLEEAVTMMREFIESSPEIWNEDIGE
ncbi:MAG: nucleoside deaminase [Planctomycetota bacterium]